MYIVGEMTLLPCLYSHYIHYLSFLLLFFFKASTGYQLKHIIKIFILSQKDLLFFFFFGQWLLNLSLKGSDKAFINQKMCCASFGKVNQTADTEASLKEGERKLKGFKSNTCQMEQ